MRNWIIILGEIVQKGFLSIFFTLLLIFSVAEAHGEGGEAIFPCSIEHAAEKIKLEKGTFFVCYFGSEPKSLADGWRHVAGASFNRILPQQNNKSEFIFQASELGDGVDYRLKDNQFELVTYFETYPDFRSVKFTHEEVDLRQVPGKYTINLIYKPKLVTKLEVDKAIAFLGIKEEKYQKIYQAKYGPGKLYEELFKIRDTATQKRI